MYENGKMRPVETILRIGGGGIKENDRGVNSTMTYCKNFGKCHNGPQYNYNVIIKISLRMQKQKSLQNIIMEFTRSTILLYLSLAHCKNFCKFTMYPSTRII
jgi:hypothetical protein